MVANHGVHKRDRWRELDRATGLTGLLATVLIFVPIIAIFALGEPAFDATRDAAAEFFHTGDKAWVTIAQATVSLGMLAFLWFVAQLSTVLRRSEGEPAWRSTVALVSGVLYAAYGAIEASWDAAFNRGDELDPNVAVFAFDLGNLGFANAWLALGSFAIVTGWLLLIGRVLAAWWAWWAIVAGAGLIAARFAWESFAWTVPYLVFWAWVIALAIRLIVRPTAAPRVS